MLMLKVEECDQKENPTIRLVSHHNAAPECASMKRL